jgi:hypothetical protein
MQSYANNKTSVSKVLAYNPATRGIINFTGLDTQNPLEVEVRPPPMSPCTISP